MSPFLQVRNHNAFFPSHLLRSTTQSTTLYDTVIQGITPNYKARLQTLKYYKVLLRTIKYCTWRYYKVLYPVLPALQRTTPYYEVKYEYYSVLIFLDSRNTWKVQYIARSNHWDGKRSGATKCMFDSSNTWNETSFKLRGVSCGMQTRLEHSGTVAFMLRSNLWDAKPR